MKGIILFAVYFFVLTNAAVYGQVIVDSELYDSLKRNNALTGLEIPTSVSMEGEVYPSEQITALSQLKSSDCDCYVEPDSSYILALQPNDDGSSNLIPIPFNFCLYGQNYNAIYINNNGNLTFSGPMATFSATAFPSSGNGIVAPFWGDVDTRDGNGQVLYKITPTAVYVNWVEVGYYSQHGDLKNTFQLIITDGTDPAVAEGNVAFCYRDMQWTTGDASDGTGGFGGVPATAGANKGDGVSYFLISRFDHPGNDFDGALADPDGISWLDYKSFKFNACNTGNVPPIPDGISNCDTFKICAFGDTALFSINFLSPENDQSTTITWNDGGLSSIEEITNIVGNTAQLVLRVIGSQVNAGIYTIDLTATDDFAPIPGVSNLSFTIIIDSSGTVLEPILTPVSGCDSVMVTVLNGPYDSYFWDDLSIDPTSMIYETDTLGLTVGLNGCYKRVEQLIQVMHPFNIQLDGDLMICYPDSLTEISIQNPTYYDSVSWGLSNASLDSLFTNSLTEGTYTIYGVDYLGACNADTTFTVYSVPAPTIFDDTMGCFLQYQITGTTAYNGGVWSASDTAVHFNSTTILDPLVWVSTAGTYTLTFTDNTCGTIVSSEVYFPAFTYTQVLDTVICIGSTYTINALQMPQNLNYTWNTGATGTSLEINQPGDYIVTATNECHTYSDTATIGIKVCDILAPNVIVLNSTNGNNVFYVDYEGVKEFECTILNRWGNIIHEYTDPAGKWDGTDKSGNKVQDGTYFYIIRAVMESGEELTKQGFVQVYNNL